MTYYVGLDLGGTNVKAGLVDAQATVLSLISVPTHAEGGPDKVIEVMAEAAAAVAANAGVKMSDVAAVGIGAPGPLDLKNGIVKAAPNMPDWHMVPLRDRISRLTGRPAVLENDANAAAFGEFWAGAGRDPSIRHMVMLTLGTGVGSGLIVDGLLVHGAFGMGGEGGHMIVHPGGRLCGCGQRGCLEAYASATNTAQRAAEALDNGHRSSLEKIRRNGGATITAKDVFDAASESDELALKIIDETAYYLGIACVNFRRLLDTQMIVFAGGMIAAGDMLFERVRQTYRNSTWTVIDDDTEIVPARLGNRAGFIGAAAVAWDAHQRQRLD